MRKKTLVEATAQELDDALGNVPNAAPELHQTIAADIDAPEHVARAIEIAKEWPPSIEGAGGDNNALALAHALADMGVSEDCAYDITLDHFNDRCEPPDAEWLRVKIHNGYEYRKEALGSKTADADFPDTDAAKVTSEIATIIYLRDIADKNKRQQQHGAGD